MKSLFIATLIALSFAQPGFAKTKAKTKKQAQTQSHTTTTKIESRSKLSTDHNLSAANVGGHYQVPVGGSVTVENEKELVDLLGVRKHFKDRLATETTRN